MPALSAIDLAMFLLETPARPFNIGPLVLLLNVTAVTLGERLQLGFLAMPDAVPHIEELARFTEQAFADLKAALDKGAAAAEPAAAPPKKSVKASVKSSPRAPRKTAAKAPAARKRAAPAKRARPASA